MGNCCQGGNETKDENVNDHTINEEIYRNCTDENTPFVSYENMRKKVKVLRVVDGDTVDIAMANEHHKIFKYRVRLYGIDTPEKKPSKNSPDRDQEIEAAKNATEAMKKKMNENECIVTVVLTKPDKYGRLLGTFYGKHGENINEWMIQQGHATEYFGKMKKPFSQVHKFKQINSTAKKTFAEIHEISVENIQTTE